MGPRDTSTPRDAHLRRGGPATTTPAQCGFSTTTIGAGGTRRKFCLSPEATSSGPWAPIWYPWTVLEHRSSPTITARVVRYPSPQLLPTLSCTFPRLVTSTVRGAVRHSVRDEDGLDLVLDLLLGLRSRDRNLLHDESARRIEHPTLPEGQLFVRLQPVEIAKHLRDIID